MVECSICGESNRMPYTCSRCNLKFCSSHQLPENHNCPSLSIPSSNTKWFKEGLSSHRRGRDVERSRKGLSVESRREPSRSPANRARGRSKTHTEVVEEENLEKAKRQTASLTNRQKRRREADSGPDILPDGTLIYPEGSDEALTVTLTRREAILSKLKRVSLAPIQKTLLFLELPLSMKLSKSLRWILVAGVVMFLLGQFGVLTVPGLPIGT